MNRNRILKILASIIIIIIVFFSCSRYVLSPSKPNPTKQELFNGVTYQRFVRSAPRDMVIHVVTVKLSKGGTKAMITPPDNPNSDRPLNARTTSEFLEEFNVKIAINGDGFQPWNDVRISYYPHSGDPVSPFGFAMSDKVEYGPEGDKNLPMLIFGKSRQVDIGYFPGTADNVISGTRILVDNGEVVSGLNNQTLHPRTAVGVNKAGTMLIIVVVDGRQPGYSNGATLQELAQILVDNGAERGMELDGGGSSTLVMADENGNAVVLNSPIHQGIPGNERPVGNHIGIFSKEK
jgi:hypothetical protein